MSGTNLKQRLINNESSYTTNKIQSPFNYKFSQYKTISEEVNGEPILNQAWSKAQLLSQDKSEAVIAKYVYTLENPRFYALLNCDLRECFKAGKIKWKNFRYKNFSELLLSKVQLFYKPITLYRGIRHFTSPIGREGDIIYSDQFESCSKNKTTALQFVGNGTVFTFKTRMAIEIGKDSEFPHEVEYLISPGETIRIDKVFLRNTINQNYHEIHLSVIYYCIRNKETGLVLDTSNVEVSIQKYNGKATQMWKVEGAFFRSVHNGKVLDIGKPSIKGSSIITWQAHGGSNQRWYHKKDGTIISGNGLALDVTRGLRAGSKLIAWTRHGKPNQLFEIVQI